MSAFQRLTLTFGGRHGQRYRPNVGGLSRTPLVFIPPPSLLSRPKPIWPNLFRIPIQNATAIPSFKFRMASPAPSVTNVLPPAKDIPSSFAASLKSWYVRRPYQFLVRGLNYCCLGGRLATKRVPQVKNGCCGEHIHYHPHCFHDLIINPESYLTLNRSVGLQGQQTQ